MKLAQWIKENSTVTDFADRLGKSRAQVHRYMNGENLSRRVIEQICAETGGDVRPSDFFEELTPERFDETFEPEVVA